MLRSSRVISRCSIYWLKGLSGRDRLGDLPASGWLYIRQSTREISFATECYPVETDSREVSEEEMENFEARVAAAGFKSFLCRDQLHDIIGNLELQRPQFTPADLGRAVDFYWRRDTFIVLDGDMA